MSTLTDYEVTVWEGTDQNANKFALGSKLQTAQTDITTLQDQIAAIDGNYPAAKGFGYIGTRTIAQIDALTPTTGLVVVAGSAGTPAAGTSDVLAIGDVAEYSGTSWLKIVAHSGGFVPDTTVLIVAPSSSTLYSPLTSGTDGSKLATFDGASNTPALTVPADGIAYAITGTSVNAGKICQYQTGAGWSVVTTPLSNAVPAALGRAAAGVSTQASRADHVHEAPPSSAVFTDDIKYLAPGANRVTNSTVETDFNDIVAVAANGLTAGSILEGRAHCYVVGVTGTPDLAIRLYIAGAAYNTVSITSVTADAAIDISYQVIVGVGGASGKAIVNVNGIAYTMAVVGTQKPNSYIADIDFTAAIGIKVSAQWSAASADNQVDLRLLTSSYRAASA